jgi:hypothetical protein
MISPSGPVKDLDGNVVTDAFGRPGFPNGFSPLATQSLGYTATMLEAGVQVVYLYVYVSDAHDNRSGSGTFGPGEAGYVAQFKQYDTAFGKFFARLTTDGRTWPNTTIVTGITTIAPRIEFLEIEQPNPPVQAGRVFSHVDLCSPTEIVATFRQSASRTSKRAAARRNLSSRPHFVGTHPRHARQSGRRIVEIGPRAIRGSA